MPTYTFNDQQGNRDRQCRYAVIFDGVCYTQSDAEAQRLAVFRSLGYKKNGKWSNTSWEVTTKSAKLIVCMSPFDGWPEQEEDCLAQVIASCYSYLCWRPTQDEARRFFEFAYPKTAQRIREKSQRIANALAELQ